ncbi:hypothetical protein BROUX41_004318 [Berkeleyomyces rouxiae]
MSDSDLSKAPRIAIKLSSKSSQGFSGNASRKNPAPVLGKRPRTHGLGGGSDSEASDGEHDGRHETITGLDSNGAETKRDTNSSKKRSAPLTITPQPTRDWRAEIMARRGGKPLETDSNKETDVPDGDKKISWGLNLLEKRDPEESTPKQPPTPASPTKKAVDETPKSIDDQALDRLLGKTEKEEIKRVIKISESEALKRDIDSAADVPDLKDYDDMPVEEFGAALLRGMGWNGEDTRPKPKAVTRRPNLLGLGAKELKEEENLGAWNNGNKRRPRLSEYNERAASRDDKNKGRSSYKEERQREKERDRGYSGHHHHSREHGKDRERDADRERRFRDNERRRDSDHSRDRERERDRGHGQDVRRDRSSKNSRESGRDRSFWSSRR